MTATRGTGLLHTQLEGWEPWGGPLARRPSGAIAADRTGGAPPPPTAHLPPRAPGRCAPWGGPPARRPSGAIVADRTGVATPYALHHLQPRGLFFVTPGVEVYEGMIIGEHNRANDTDVNAVREKKLSNVRNHGKDENVLLAVPHILSIDTALEWIDADELVEVTPDAVRVRKQVLS